MKSAQSQVAIGQRKPLVKNLLVVEGISRAGKFLLANLMHGFEDIEPVQSCGIVEQIPFLEHFRLIDARIAQEFLRYEVDTHCYETLLGRTLNHRRADKSSIYNIPHYAEYARRAKEKDPDKELNKFYKSKAYSFFIVHELMPNIKIFFATFPHLKVVSIQRSPVDLVYSWYQRGLAQRLGNDPKLFIISMRRDQTLVPWYAYKQARVYQELNDMGRTILAITSLFKLYRQGYQRLSSQQKKRLVMVRYDDILQKPQSVIYQLKKFIHKKPRSTMEAILRRERLPNPNYGMDKTKKIQTIKTLASPQLFKQLMKLEKSFYP